MKFIEHRVADRRILRLIRKWLEAELRKTASGRRRSWVHEIDGFALLLHVKKHYPRIPFVFVTAVNDESVKKAAMRSGAEDFLLKPFRQEELLAVVGQALGELAE